MHGLMVCHTSGVNVEDVAVRLHYLSVARKEDIIHELSLSSDSGEGGDAPLKRAALQALGRLNLYSDMNYICEDTHVGLSTTLLIVISNTDDPISSGFWRD